MSSDLPEPPHLHHGGGALPRWLEWLTSISALVISVSSIFIAIHNGHNEDKMVQAASYPYLEISRDSATPEGVKRMSLNLVNNGVGPAHEESLTIKLGGRYITSLNELIASTVGPAEAPQAMTALKQVRNTQPTRFIPANKSQFIFIVFRTDANARWWDRVSEANQKLQVSVCYCSVFNDCWVRHDEAEPTPVKACRRDEPHEFN